MKDPRWCARRVSRSLVAFVLAGLVFGGVVMGAPTVHVHRHDVAAQDRIFERVEWVVKLDREYGNPFDPEEIAVDAKLTSPSGRTMVLPGFWYQAQRRDTGDGGRE
ncbi:MAG: DUF5060 domain-containing protein, partial [Bacillota bacterium]